MKIRKVIKARAIRDIPKWEHNLSKGHRKGWHHTLDTKDRIRAKVKAKWGSGDPPFHKFEKGNIEWIKGKKEKYKHQRYTQALLMGLNNKGRKCPQGTIEANRKRFTKKNPLWNEETKLKWKKSHKRWGRFKKQ